MTDETKKEDVAAEGATSAATDEQTSTARNDAEETTVKETETTAATDAASTVSNDEVSVASDESSDVPTSDEEGDDESEKKTSVSKGMIALAIVGFAMFVSAGLYWYQTQYHAPSSSTTIAALKDLPSVVAVVNGENVSADDYRQSYQQAAAQASQQGFDPASTTIQTEIKKQAMDVIVNTVLITQAAEKAGMTATSGEVDAQISQLKSQLGGDAQFTSALSSAGLTEDGVRSDLTKQIEINKYLNSLPEWQNATVTDQEKHDFYDQISQYSTSTPPFDQVESQITAQLLSQKQQAVTQNIIDQLRASSTIETKI